MQHFSGSDGIGSVGQDLHHPVRFQFHHQLEAARVEEVSDQYRRGIAPDPVGGGLAAASFRSIDHVIVEQCRGVNELDDRGQLDMVSAAIAACAGCQQVNQRSQSLAASIDDVFGDLVDQQHIRAQSLADQIVRGMPVGRAEAHDLVQRGRRGNRTDIIHGAIIRCMAAVAWSWRWSGLGIGLC